MTPPAGAAAPKPRRRAGNVTELPVAKPARRPRRKPAIPADLGTPPPWLSKTAAEAWRGLIPKLEDALPDGALSLLDVPALGLMLEHFAIATSAAESMRTTEGDHVPIDVDEAHRDRLRKSPASQVMRDHGKAFVELAREYGLTARSRANLDAEALSGFVPDVGDDDDLFDD